MKKSFIAIEEMEGNTHLRLVYDIIDPNTKSNPYSQDYHLTHQEILDPESEIYITISDNP